MIKTGIDLVLNKRIEEKLNNLDFISKVFHPGELKNKAKLSGIFALKEATMKAIGKKLNWKDIEIKFEKTGRPIVSLSNEIKPKNFKCIDGSISHDGDYTIAIAIIELS